MSQNHIVSFNTYLKVLIILLILTVLTVAVAQFNFGPFNAFIAFLIAFIKGGLVLLYFMHLKYDNKFYAAIFGSSVFFVVLLYLFSKLDIVTRVPPEAFL